MITYMCRRYALIARTAWQRSAFQKIVYESYMIPKRICSKGPLPYEPSQDDAGDEEYYWEYVMGAWIRSSA